MQDNTMNDDSTNDLLQDLSQGRAIEWAEMVALNAVSDAERSLIEDHISATTPAERAAFEERVRSARETLAQAYGIDDVEPPAALFDRIVAQLPATAVPAPVAAPDDAGQARVEAPQGDDLTARRAAKQQRTKPLGRWLVAAAAAVVITVGGVSVAQNLQDTSVEQEVLQAQDLQTDTFTIPAGGTADLKLSRAEDAAVITLSEVPAPPTGMVYQMWRVPTDGSNPVSVSTMSAADLEESLVTTVEGIGSAMGFAITVEPDGGSETPTMPIIAEIPFEA